MERLIFSNKKGQFIKALDVCRQSSTQYLKKDKGA